MSDAMSIGGVSATPAIAPSKAESQTTKQTEGFERMLLGQLTKELVDTAMPSDPEAAAATGAYKQLLPDALTEALMSGGGIGLAKQLADASAKKVTS
jgi:Rod binding domain-containing protein